MKVVIYHTSHTGTGLFVANKVKEQLQKTGEYSSIDIKNINKIMQQYRKDKTIQLDTYDLYIIGTFADFFAMTLATKQFMELPQLDLHGHKVATFDTNGGFPGAIEYQFRHYVFQKGGIFSGHLSMKSHSNNFDKAKDGKIKAIDPAIYELINQFVANINKINVKTDAGLALKVKGSACLGMQKLVARNSHARMKILLKSDLIVLSDKCIGCGKCVNECPANVYDLVDGKAKLARREDCLVCLGCIHNCPVGAIQTEKNREFQQYHFNEYYINKKKGLQSIKLLQEEYQSAAAQ